MSWLSPARWLLYGALVIAVLFGIKALDQSRQAIGYDKAHAEYTAIALLVSEAARTREAAWQDQLTKANEDAQIRNKALALDAGRARAESSQLRIDITAIRANLPGLAADARAELAAVSTGLLADCADQYRGVSAEADALWSDRQALIDAWPKN